MNFTLSSSSSDPVTTIYHSMIMEIEDKEDEPEKFLIIEYQYPTQGFPFTHVEYDFENDFDSEFLEELGITRNDLLKRCIDCIVETGE